MTNEEAGCEMKQLCVKIGPLEIRNESQDIEDLEEEWKRAKAGVEAYLEMVKDEPREDLEEGRE